MIDPDLQGIWIFKPPAGQDVSGYGEQPFRFRPARQNGSRIRLRLLAPDGTDARWGTDTPFLTGTFIERAAYTSDLRRGIFWQREGGSHG